jgi:uncharacterized protein YjlB
MIENHVSKMEISTYLFEGDGTFPNNEKLPVLLYKNAIPLSKDDAAAEMEKLFKKNKWKNSWRDGIYHFHHYHSTAHEALGVYAGRASVQVGGPLGETINLIKGDVLVIPAGVAHKSSGNSEDFKCVGAYPPGQNYDMNYGDSDERDEADLNIRQLPLPAADPVLGNTGGLNDYWKSKAGNRRQHRNAPMMNNHK